MVPNDILLYPQIDALLDHHQGGFLQVKMSVGAETHNQTLYEEILIWRSLWGHFLQSSGNTEGEERLQESERMEDTRIWLIESNKQSSYRHTETEAISMGPAKVCTRSSVYLCYQCQLGFFVGLLMIGEGVSVTLLLVLQNFYLLLGCLVQHLYIGFCLVILYILLSCLAVVSCGPALCCRDMEGSGFGEQEAREAQRTGGRSIWLGFII